MLTYLETQLKWGNLQADIYDDFLFDTLQSLAEHPRIGSIVENVGGMRRYFARWKNARNGHHIFYEETGEGILVFRILHTSMNWSDHIPTDD